jgi:hypothetical protein
LAPLPDVGQFSLTFHILFTRQGLRHLPEVFPVDIFHGIFGRTSLRDVVG